MKITTQLVILTLSLLLVNADQYCDNMLKQYHLFRSKCSPARITVKSCCDLTGFPLSKAPSAVYQMNCKCGGYFTTANAYCDMSTDSGGWVVIQRNKKDSLVNFNKNWTEYEEGFGDLNKEFWYGLAAISCLTQRSQWEMRVDYQFNNGTWSYLHYNNFSIGSASEEYPLTVGGFTGVGTDYFTSFSSKYISNKMKFSTIDNDNDKNRGNCAASYKSGWWYNNCHSVNINRQPPDVYSRVLFSEMKIRPKDCIIQ